MRSTIVNSSELFQSEDNPTGCWSPHRYLDDCQNCNHFMKAMEGRYTLTDVLAKLKCKPKLNGDMTRAIKKYLKEKLRSDTVLKKAREDMRTAGQPDE